MPPDVAYARNLPADWFMMLRMTPFQLYGEVVPARKVCERDSERSRGRDCNLSLTALAVVQTTNKCSFYQKEVQSYSGGQQNLKAVSAQWVILPVNFLSHVSHMKMYDWKEKEDWGDVSFLVLCHTYQYISTAKKCHRENPELQPGWSWSHSPMYTAWNLASTLSWRQLKMPC